MKKDRKKPKGSSDLDFKYFLYGKIYNLLGKAMLYATIIAVCYIIADSVVVVLTYKYWFSSFVFLIFVILKLYRLNRKKTQKMTAHTEALEKVIDPSRTSSGLTRGGSTNPEDK